MADSPRFEPGTEFFATNGDVQTHALASIAVSMKRIADALEYDPKNSNLYDLFNDIRHNKRGSP
jgi:hypothetical protein